MYDPIEEENKEQEKRQEEEQQRQQDNVQNPKQIEQLLKRVEHITDFCRTMETPGMEGEERGGEETADGTEVVSDATILLHAVHKLRKVRCLVKITNICILQEILMVLGTKYSVWVRIYQMGWRLSAMRQYCYMLCISYAR